MGDRANVLRCSRTSGRASSSAPPEPLTSRMPGVDSRGRPRRACRFDEMRREHHNYRQVVATAENCFAKIVFARARGNTNQHSAAVMIRLPS